MNSKIAEIKGKIEKKVLHPYLLKYIQVPIIDSDKLLLLVSAMEGLDLTDRERENYALTATLVQIALDIHEHVTNSQSLAGTKERQLTVLAGDYYSGLYYKHLAESDDILMIRSLSRGIKKVNEHKTLLYQKEFKSVGLLLDSIKSIEASVLAKFSGFFGRDAWIPFMESFLLMKRLLKERNDFLRDGISPFFDALEAVVETVDLHGGNRNSGNLVELLDHELVSLRIELKERMNAVKNINEAVRSRAEELLGEIKIFVEEG
ncbi:heptaprenyl diphosphate synthase component 1 [Neobacillus sp. YIM B06451]|uniref:heptaprenyl diphosphate synthase component 1 n=1 Tax=Neobacillus sp. YIM B06451 TaxID=3070994 RepID=UPI0029311D18|nr:heptaprenyl diphosphate synthase component 1 [Neobacillus sp. YIM B06451]